MGHYVYKYVLGDEIVYIGKNDTDLHSRIYQHSLEDKFQTVKDAQIYYIELQNSVESRVMEELLINKYKPVLNIVSKQNGLSISFEELHWKRYVPLEKSNRSKKRKRGFEVVTMSDCYDNLSDIQRRFLDMCAKSMRTEMSFKAISDIAGISDSLDSIKNFMQDMYNISIEESDGKSLHIFPWIHDCGVSPSQQTVYIVLDDKVRDFLRKARCDYE